MSNALDVATHMAGAAIALSAAIASFLAGYVVRMLEEKPKR